MKRGLVTSSKRAYHTKAALRRVQVKPNKLRGQNFLTNETAIDSIVNHGTLTGQERVLEFGPGLGALTDRLVSKVSHLTLVELESNFCKELSERYPHCTVIQGDAKIFDFKTLDSFQENQDKFVVFGNLPYIFSTDIIFNLVQNRQFFSRAILLLQKEFAERVAASPGSRSYGTISVMVQSVAFAELGDIIGGHNFYPTTKVQSRVLRINVKPNDLIPSDAFFPYLRKVVKGSFLQRRRMIANSLVSSGLFPKERILDALETVGIDSKRRAETVSVEEYHALTNELYPNQLEGPHKA